MWIVALALRRPYTFIVMALVIIILTPITILRTPTDIFPDIDIPVVSVVWFYTGMSPQDMADRIVANSERGITTTVNDIEHMESQSVYGLGIIKVFFRPGTNVQGAIAQRDLPDYGARPAARHYAATDHLLQRFYHSYHSTRAEQQNSPGTTIVRPWPELSAYLSGHRAGSRHPIPLRRQDPPDSGGPGLAEAPGLRPPAQ
jgi:multidrug efflux pump subunit AcrB